MCVCQFQRSPEGEAALFIETLGTAVGEDGSSTALSAPV